MTISPLQVPRVVPQPTVLEITMRNAPSKVGNDNVVQTARGLAERRWTGQAAKETVKSGIAAAGFESGMVAVAVPAFLGVMGLAAYTYLSDQKYYDNRHFVPCGMEPRLSPKGRQLFRGHLHESQVTRTIQEIADLEIRVFQLEKLGMTADARLLRERINTLEAQAHGILIASPMLGNPLQIKASATDGGHNSGIGEDARELTSDTIDPGKRVRLVPAVYTNDNDPEPKATFLIPAFMAGAFSGVFGCMMSVGIGHYLGDSFKEMNATYKMIGYGVGLAVFGIKWYLNRRAKQSHEAWNVRRAAQASSPSMMLLSYASGLNPARQELVDFIKGIADNDAQAMHRLRDVLTRDAVLFLWALDAVHDQRIFRYEDAVKVVVSLVDEGVVKTARNIRSFPLDDNRYSSASRLLGVAAKRHAVVDFVTRISEGDRKTIQSIERQLNRDPLPFVEVMHSLRNLGIPKLDLAIKTVEELLLPQNLPGKVRVPNAIASDKQNVVAQKADGDTLAIRWNPIERIGGNNIHIRAEGDARTMSEWIISADRSRYLKAGALLVIGNVPLATLITDATRSPGLFLVSTLATVVSCFSSAYFSQGGSLKKGLKEFGDSCFGLTLRWSLSQEDRPSSEMFATVMSAWYRELVKQSKSWTKLKSWDDYTLDDVRATLKSSKKTVDGVEYDLLDFMDMTPFFKLAEVSCRGAYVLDMFEESGRVWTPADESAIKSLQIRWGRDDLKRTYPIQWLANHGNENVVIWVYDHARAGEGQAQAIFNQLLLDRNPLALSLFEAEKNTGGISVVQNPVK